MHDMCGIGNTLKYPRNPSPMWPIGQGSALYFWGYSLAQTHETWTRWNGTMAACHVIAFQLILISQKLLFNRMLNCTYMISNTINPYNYMCNWSRWSSSHLDHVWLWLPVTAFRLSFSIANGAKTAALLLRAHEISSSGREGQFGHGWLIYSTSDGVQATYWWWIVRSVHA